MYNYYNIVNNYIEFKIYGIIVQKTMNTKRNLTKIQIIWSDTMSISKDEYSKMADKASPNSPILINCLKAFLFGGLICTLGQAITEILKNAGLGEKEAAAGTSAILIMITAILTGIGVFDKIARHAGAGTIVPITGFANSVVSPALEFQHEGFILGTAAQMFTIAGPVIVYGVASSFIYGLIIFLFKLY